VDVTTGELQWKSDPIQLALRASTQARVRGRNGPVLPTPYCVEVGRRLLLAQLEFSRWVLRRVETVSFEQGRSVARKMTIEFAIRPDAPSFLVEEDDGAVEELWLVPLTIMKRRTLVDFQLHNEDGTPLTLPGLRLTQQLDESMLLAAAATLAKPDDTVRSFVRDVVAGDRLVVAEAMRRYEDGDLGEQLAALRNHDLFVMTLDRLRFNFTLYVLLSRERGRHRLLHMSFVEPISWRYQRAQLDRESGDFVTYTPMIPVPWDTGHLASELGLTPTRVRLQTPAAEYAASYHLEVVAPPGVRIVNATLLAGRPHMADRAKSLDSQRGDYLTVGLHAVEVPPNSLCRAQLELRVERAGWLTTLLIATLAVFLVLFSVAYHAVRQRAPDPVQDTNVIVLLITTAAAAAAFLSQRDFTGVAARLILWMRAVGALSMALPVVAAGLLAYGQVSEPLSELEQRLPDSADGWTKWGSCVLAGLAFGLFALVLTTWWRTRSDEAKTEVSSSWDQSLQAKADLDAERRQQKLTFNKALEEYGLDLPAVGVRSSEGWHRDYRWRPDDFEQAVEALNRLAGDDRIALHYRCDVPGDCPHAGRDGCGVQYRLGSGNAAGHTEGTADLSRATRQPSQA
jgi:hypothetical protein